MKFIFFLKNFLAPKKCINCSSLGAFLCDNCLCIISKNLPFCYVCKRTIPKFEIHQNCKKDIFFDALIVPYHYREGSIKNAITDGKFYKKQEIFEEIGTFIAPFIEDTLQLYDFKDYVITPIPLHIFRLWKRGYNQSEILAKTLADELKIDFFPLLKKRKHTRQQSHLSRSQRLKNIQDCFTINKTMLDKVDSKTILLIDDVVSTGATLNEAARVLKGYGAKKIIGIVIASD